MHDNGTKLISLSEVFKEMRFIPKGTQYGQYSVLEDSPEGHETALCSWPIGDMGVATGWIPKEVLFKITWVQK